MKGLARIGVLLTIAASITFLPAAPAMAAVNPRIATALVYPDWSENLPPVKTSQLWIDLWNDGDEIATGVTATLSSSDPYIDVVEPGPRTFTNIEVKNEVTPSSNDEPFGVAVGATEECVAHFELAVSTDQGDFVVPFEVPIEPCTPPPPPPAPRIYISGIAILDPESGEELEDLTLGRAVDIEIELTNEGELDAESVAGELSIPGGGAEVSDATADFGGVPVAGSSTRTFGLTLKECDPAGLLIYLAIEGAPVLEVQHGATPPPEGTLDYVLPSRCPGMHLSPGGLRYDDAAGGNGDGIPQPGETISVFISVVNRSADTLTGMIGTLESANADVLQNDSPFPAVEPREEVENSEAFIIRVHEDAPTSVALSGGCSTFLNIGDSFVHLPGGTVFAHVFHTLEIEGDQGSTSFSVFGWGAVCAETVETTEDELPETGSTTMPLSAAGTSFVVIGWLMRRRAARRA